MNQQVSSKNVSETTTVTQPQQVAEANTSSRLGQQPQGTSIERQTPLKEKSTTQAPPAKSSMGGGATTNNRQIGHYIVGRSLGQGTFGKVRLGTHILTNEKVAIKILEKDKIKDQSDVERVTREIHILKVVRHPNVIQLYEIIETSKQLFLIMEYANGGELFDYIVKRKRLQESEACKFFQQIISGVEYIHRVRICHRDLKPENLLLDDKNNIKIVDFGLSNTYKEGETLKTACGSPCYAAPEMIAGKRYNGLISDIWSCGIILYAMACGYLPFEDPNTNKLYKKILNCDYLIPGFISSNCKDLIRRVLNTDPQLRYKIKDIRSHDWFSQIKVNDLEGIVVGKDKIPVIEEALIQMIKESQDKTLGGGLSVSDPNFYNQASTYIQNNKHNQVTSTYYLILKKLERESGRNYVFEAAQLEKRKYAQSTGHLSTVNFGSPAQSNSLNRIGNASGNVAGGHSKLMMNQTALINSSVFNRAGPQESSKSSDGKIDSGLTQQPKKYHNQIEKIYTKRAESIGGQISQQIATNHQGQRPTTDSVSSYNVANFNMSLIEPSNNRASTYSGAGPIIDSSHFSTLASGVRVANNQSPNSRILNVVNIQSNASAGATINKGAQHQQTFYMADRLKKSGNGGGSFLKNHQNHHIRHGSVDENPMMVIQSTNDSRVEEMLPNVNNSGQSQHRQNTKSVQMRSTMYNNSYFQKLISNVQGTSAQNQLLQKQKEFVNIVDQKKKNQPASVDISSGAGAINANPNQTALAQSIMIKTSYGSGFTSSSNGNGQQPSYLVNAAASIGMHSNVISKALAQQKIRKFRQNQVNAQLRNNSEGAHGHILNLNGEHSFSQEITQASTDPLNNTTMASGEIMNNSVINVANFDSLLGGINSGAKHITQKKVDSNLFTIYRPTGTSQQKKAAHHQKGTAILLNQGNAQQQNGVNGSTVFNSYSNRFDSSLNNSLGPIGGQDNIAPFTSATTGQSSLLMMSAEGGSHMKHASLNGVATNHLGSTGAVTRFSQNNNSAKINGGNPSQNINNTHNRFLSYHHNNNQNGNQQSTTLSSGKQSHQIPVFQQNNNFMTQGGKATSNAPQKTMSNGFYSSVATKNAVKNNESFNKETLAGAGWIGENMIALGSSNKQAEHVRMKLMNGTLSNFHAHTGSVGSNGSNTATQNKRIVIL